MTSTTAAAAPTISPPRQRRGSSPLRSPVIPPRASSVGAIVVPDTRPPKPRMAALVTPEARPTVATKSEPPPALSTTTPSKAMATSMTPPPPAVAPSRGTATFTDAATGVVLVAACQTEASQGMQTDDNIFLDTVASPEMRRAVLKHRRLQQLEADRQRALAEIDEIERYELLQDAEEEAAASDSPAAPADGSSAALHAGDDQPTVAGGSTLVATRGSLPSSGRARHSDTARHHNALLYDNDDDDDDEFYVRHGDRRSRKAVDNDRTGRFWRPIADERGRLAVPRNTTAHSTDGGCASATPSKGNDSARAHYGGGGGGASSIATSQRFRMSHGPDDEDDDYDHTRRRRPDGRSGSADVIRPFQGSRAPLPDTHLYHVEGPPSSVPSVQEDAAPRRPPPVPDVAHRGIQFDAPRHVATSVTATATRSTASAYTQRRLSGWSDLSGGRQHNGGGVRHPGRGAWDEASPTHEDDPLDWGHPILPHGFGEDAMAPQSPYRGYRQQESRGTARWSAGDLPADNVYRPSFPAYSKADSSGRGRSPSPGRDGDAVDLPVYHDPPPAPPRTDRSAGSTPPVVRFEAATSTAGTQYDGPPVTRETAITPVRELVDAGQQCREPTPLPLPPPQPQPQQPPALPMPLPASMRDSTTSPVSRAVVQASGTQYDGPPKTQMTSTSRPPTPYFNVAHPPSHLYQQPPAVVYALPLATVPPVTGGRSLSTSSGPPSTDGGEGVGSARRPPPAPHTKRLLQQAAEKRTIGQQYNAPVDAAVSARHTPSVHQSTQESLIQSTPGCDDSAMMAPRGPAGGGSRTSASHPAPYDALPWATTPQAPHHASRLELTPASPAAPLTGGLTLERNFVETAVGSSRPGSPKHITHDVASGVSRRATPFEHQHVAVGTSRPASPPPVQAPPSQPASSRFIPPPPTPGVSAAPTPSAPLEIVGTKLPSSRPRGRTQMGAGEAPPMLTPTESHSSAATTSQDPFPQRIAPAAASAASAKQPPPPPPVARVSTDGRVTNTNSPAAAQTSPTPIPPPQAVDVPPTAAQPPRRTVPPPPPTPPEAEPPQPQPTTPRPSPAKSHTSPNRPTERVSLREHRYGGGSTSVTAHPPRSHHSRSDSEDVVSATSASSSTGLLISGGDGVGKNRAAGSIMDNNNIGGCVCVRLTLCGFNAAAFEYYVSDGRDANATKFVELLHRDLWTSVQGFVMNPEDVTVKIFPGSVTDMLVEPDGEGPSRLRLVHASWELHVRATIVLRRPDLRAPVAAGYGAWQPESALSAAATLLTAYLTGPNALVTAVTFAEVRLPHLFRQFRPASVPSSSSSPMTRDTDIDSTSVGSPSSKQVAGEQTALTIEDVSVTVKRAVRAPTQADAETAVDHDVVGGTTVAAQTSLASTPLPRPPSDHRGATASQPPPPPPSRQLENSLPPQPGGAAPTSPATSSSPPDSPPDHDDDDVNASAAPSAEIRRPAAATPQRHPHRSVRIFVTHAATNTSKPPTPMHATEKTNPNHPSPEGLKRQSPASATPTGRASATPTAAQMAATTVAQPVEIPVRADIFLTSFSSSRFLHVPGSRERFREALFEDFSSSGGIVPPLARIVEVDVSAPTVGLGIIVSLQMAVLTSDATDAVDAVANQVANYCSTAAFAPSFLSHSRDLYASMFHLLGATGGSAPPAAVMVDMRRSVVDGQPLSTIVRRAQRAQPLAHPHQEGGGGGAVTLFASLPQQHGRRSATGESPSSFHSPVVQTIAAQRLVEICGDAPTAVGAHPSGGGVAAAASSRNDKQPQPSPPPTPPVSPAAAGALTARGVEGAAPTSGADERPQADEAPPTHRLDHATATTRSGQATPAAPLQAALVSPPLNSPLGVANAAPPSAVAVPKPAAATTSGDDWDPTAPPAAAMPSQSSSSAAAAPLQPLPVLLLLALPQFSFQRFVQTRPTLLEESLRTDMCLAVNAAIPARNVRLEWLSGSAFDTRCPADWLVVRVSFYASADAVERQPRFIHDVRSALRETMLNQSSAKSFPRFKQILHIDTTASTLIEHWKIDDAFLAAHGGEQHPSPQRRSQEGPTSTLSSRTSVAASNQGGALVAAAPAVHRSVHHAPAAAPTSSWPPSGPPPPRSDSGSFVEVASEFGEDVAFNVVIAFPEVAIGAFLARRSRNPDFLAGIQDAACADLVEGSGGASYGVGLHDIGIKLQVRQAPPSQTAADRSSVATTYMAVDAVIRCHSRHFHTVQRRLREFLVTDRAMTRAKLYLVGEVAGTPFVYGIDRELSMVAGSRLVD